MYQYYVLALSALATSGKFTIYTTKQINIDLINETKRLFISYPTFLFQQMRYRAI